MHILQLLLTFKGCIHDITLSVGRTISAYCHIRTLMNYMTPMTVSMHPYLLITKINGSFTVNHFLQALDVFGGRVLFAPVDPS